MSYTAAIFYVDFEGGNDAARTALTGCVISNPSGSVISVNKTAHGLVVGAIVDATLFQAWFNAAWKVLSVTDADNFVVEGTWQAAADNNGTITPRGGSSKADAWKNSPSSARHQAGDFVRYMASPPATSLGVNGTWTDGPLPASLTPTSTTNATPINLFKNTGHGLTTGDTIVMDSHTTNTAANGTWTVTVSDANNATLDGSVGNGVGGTTGSFRKVTNAVVKLASAVGGDNVACPRDGETGNRGTKTNWTASANVTCTVLTTDFKQGGECQQIAIAAGFTTGLAAYLALASAKDYSGRQQLTFWIKQTAGTVGAAGSIRLRLCSDTAGATPVDTFDVPNLGALNQWVAFTVDKGSALGSSIQSINLDVVTDNGAQTFLLDCIRTVNAASSADSLSLTSLIGKSGGTDSSWLAVQSILGTRVMLDQINNTIPAGSPQRGYTGTTETVTTYKRQPFLDTVSANNTSSPNSLLVNVGGASFANQVTHSFGWDRTNMSSQSDQSWYSGQNGLGVGFGRLGATNYILTDGILGLSRYGVGGYYTLGAVNITAGLHVNNCGTAHFNNQCYRSSWSFESARNNNAMGSSVGDGVAYPVLNQFGSSATWNHQGGSRNFGTVVQKNNAAAGISFGSALAGGMPSIIQSLVSADNAVAINMSCQTDVYLKGAVINDAVEVNGGSLLDYHVYSENHDGTAGNTQVFVESGRIYKETTIVDSGAAVSWALAVTNANRDVYWPLTFNAAGTWKTAVKANLLVTITLRCYRTNTGITARLMVKGGQIAGVPSDVVASAAGSAGAWETLTVTFTPTEIGVIEWEAQAYGGTTYIAYFGPVTVSQA